MLANFVEETCTGTGDLLTLQGAILGHVSVSVAYADQASVYYVVEDANGVIKVAGSGIYTAATNTIARDDNWSWNGVSYDTNPASNIALSAGVHKIRVSMTKENLTSVIAAQVNDISWSIVSSDTPALPKKGYLVDCSTNPVVVTLPANPTTGDSIGISDFTHNSKTNNITIARNGNKISGLDEDLIANISGAGFIIVFTNALIGWEIVSEVGIPDVEIPEIYYPYTYDEFDVITTKSSLNVTGDVTADSLTADTLSGSLGEITANSNLTVNGVITETSSIRYKENVRELNSPLDSVLNLHGVMYDRKSGASNNAGFIAEEVEMILPNVIKYENGMVEGISYTQLIAYLVESIKELNQKIVSLEEALG